MGVVQKVLGIGLSVFFSLVGGKKVFDYNNQDANALKQFEEFAKVFPLRPFGITPAADVYLLVVGGAEFALGLALLFGPRGVRRLACKGLMLIMAGAIQTLLAMGLTHMAPIPATFFIAVFILHHMLQTDHRQKKD